MNKMAESKKLELLSKSPQDTKFKLVTLDIGRLDYNVDQIEQLNQMVIELKSSLELIQEKLTELKVTSSTKQLELEQSDMQLSNNVNTLFKHVHDIQAAIDNVNQTITAAIINERSDVASINENIEKLVELIYHETKAHAKIMIDPIEARPSTPQDEVIDLIGLSCKINSELEEYTAVPGKEIMRDDLLNGMLKIILNISNLQKAIIKKLSNINQEQRIASATATAAINSPITDEKISELSSRISVLELQMAQVQSVSSGTLISKISEIESNLSDVKSRGGSGIHRARSNSQLRIKSPSVVAFSPTTTPRQTSNLAE